MTKPPKNEVPQLPENVREIAIRLSCWLCTHSRRGYGRDCTICFGSVGRTSLPTRFELAPAEELWHFRLTGDGFGFSDADRFIILTYAAMLQEREERHD